MSKDDLLKTAEEAIQLEQNVSNLYLIFQQEFPEDAQFWWTLVQEESNHAALIKSGIRYFMPLNKFPMLS